MASATVGSTRASLPRRTLRSPLVDLLGEIPTPDPPPMLTGLEEARAGVELAHQIDLDWRMASEDAPDVEVLLAELLDRPEWHRQAACRGAGPDLFFPERGEKPVQGLAYCEDCSVRPQCLASALEGRPRRVWGATTGRQRRGLRRVVA